MNANLKAALCTALAIAAFIAAYGGLRFTPLAAAVVAVAVLIAAWIAVPRRREAAEIELAPGVTKAAHDDALTRIRATAAALERTARAIGDAKVGGAVEGLARLSRSIADELAEDPGDLRRVWEFLDYQQPQAAKIVDRFARLDRAGDKSQEETLRLAVVGHAILEIEGLFTAQLRALRADDFATLTENVTAMKAIALRVDAAKLPARVEPGG